MKNVSLRNTVLDFNIGGMGEARLKGVRFAKYQIHKADDDFYLIPDLLYPDQITAIEPYYKVTGQELMLRILNLYKSLDTGNLENAASVIQEWCLKNIHPYTLPEFFACGDLSWEEHWINLWGSGVGTISVRDFVYECKKFYETTSAVLTLMLIQTGREKEADSLYHTYFHKSGFDLYAEYMHNEHFSKEFLAADNYAMIPPVSMRVDFDEKRMQPVFIAEVHSIFDMLYYTLTRMVAANTPELDESWRRQCIALCESCGNLFIKEGNRQKYCKDPLCQAERNNRKAQAYYLRKQQNKHNGDSNL